jgi:RimJ/RimL family protein N-acetyltransferase
VAELPLPEPPLRDGIVALRPWSAADVDAACTAMRDELILRFTRVPDDQTEDDVRRTIAEREQARKAGATLSLVIADTHDDTFLGTVSLLRFDWRDRRCEIGYWLAASARGRGVATRAVVLLSRWALRDLKLARIALCTDTDNLASRAVAERSGFTREGVLRSYEQRKGRHHDVVAYSLLPDDLP